MPDHFDTWINSMSDDEYEDWLEAPFSQGGASDAQEEKALNIRTPPTNEEIEALEDEQEFDALSKQEQEYRDAERKEKKRQFKENITINDGITELQQPVGEPITIRKVGDRVTMTRTPMSTPDIGVSQTPPRIIPPSRPAMQSFRTSITNAVSSAGKFIRRFFRV